MASDPRDRTLPPCCQDRRNRSTPEWVPGMEGHTSFERCLGRKPDGTVCGNRHILTRTAPLRLRTDEPAR